MLLGVKRGRVEVQQLVRIVMNEPSIDLQVSDSKQIGIAAVTVESPSKGFEPAVVVLIGENPTDFNLPFVFSILTPKQAIALADDLKSKAAIAKRMRRVN